MGFLRFLSKGKDKRGDDLDVPPAPPTSLDFSDFDKEFSAPLPGDEMSSQLGSFPSEPSFPKQDDFPSFDDLKFGDEQQQAPQMPEPSRLPSFLSNAPQPQPTQGAPAAQSHEHYQTKGAVYVKVDDYRQLMADLTMIRSDLRKAGLGLGEMAKTITEREKDYGRYKNALIDIQKKLVFMDKTLFSKR